MRARTAPTNVVSGVFTFVCQTDRPMSETPASPSPDHASGGRATVPLRALAIAAVFAALAYTGIALTREPGSIAILWLPNAVLVAVLLRTQIAHSSVYVSACLIANILVNLLTGANLPSATVLAFANAIEVLLAVWIMRRTCGDHPDVGELQTLGWLLVVCVCAPSVSGAIAAVDLAASGRWFDTATFFSWALADGMSMMIVTPTVMIAVDAWRRRTTPSVKDVAE